MKCHLCKDKQCSSGNKNCYIDKAPEISQAFIHASEIEVKYYNEYNRFQELIEYCRLNNYKKLGIAFCIGLSSEAETFCNILDSYGFQTISVCCKLGGIDKSRYKLPKLRPDGKEAICNPYFQAQICNKAETQLNIILGLCIGHDIEFSNNSHAPITTFIVKDRVLGHNPVASLYSRYIKDNI